MIFGMDWRIFSAQEVRTFIQEAKDYGLVPPGEIVFGQRRETITSGERDDTFAWLVFQKITPARG